MKRRDFLRAVGAGTAMAAGVPAVAGMTQASAAAGVTADAAMWEIFAAWRARERVSLLRHAVLSDSPTVRMSARQLLREADQASAIADLMRGVA